MKKRFKDGLPLLDPIDDMGIKDEGLKSIVRVGVYTKCKSQIATVIVITDNKLVITDNKFTAINQPSYVNRWVQSNPRFKIKDRW